MGLATDKLSVRYVDTLEQPILLRTLIARILGAAFGLIDCLGFLSFINVDSILFIYFVSSGLCLLSSFSYRLVVFVFIFIILWFFSLMIYGNYLNWVLLKSFLLFSFFPNCNLDVKVGFSTRPFVVDLLKSCGVFVFAWYCYFDMCDDGESMDPRWWCWGG